MSDPTKVVVYYEINHALTTETDLSEISDPEDIDAIVGAAMDLTEDDTMVPLCHHCAEKVGNTMLEGGDPSAVSIGDRHYVRRGGKWVREVTAYRRRAR